MEIALNSTLIDSIAYNRGTLHLRVFLSNGQRREYEDVPSAVIDKFIAARSPGEFYAAHIRGKYRIDEN